MPVLSIYLQGYGNSQGYDDEYYPSDRLAPYDIDNRIPYGMEEDDEYVPNEMLRVSDLLTDSITATVHLQRNEYHTQLK